MPHYGRKDLWSGPLTNVTNGDKMRCECGEAAVLSVFDCSGGVGCKLRAFCDNCGQTTMVVCKRCGTPVPAASSRKADAYCSVCFEYEFGDLHPGLAEWLFYKPPPLDRARLAVRRELEKRKWHGKS